MHITLTFNSEKQDFIRVPRANLHLFQALIYNALPKETASFLHSEGYIIKGKHIKLFAMSWPISSRSPVFEQNAIRFFLPVKIVVSSPIIKTIEGLTNGILNSEALRIGNNLVTCEKIEAEYQRVNENSVTIRTLSPVTCYTRTERNGKPYTHYYNPDNQEFENLIYNNLLLKFQVLYPEKLIPHGKINVIPVGDLYERLSRFSEKQPFPVIGWWGKFCIEGPKELLQIALDCGIGAKNSGGWGCITKEVQK